MIKKEALFNEVKGSLFEFLVARRLAVQVQNELDFIKSLDKNYLTVLTQQDRMVRQFYPEMLPFLEQVSEQTVAKLIDYLGENPTSPRLLGKFTHSLHSQDFHEADLLIKTSKGEEAISLKLNKKNAYVNTKSGGIKSFFSQYFSFLPPSIQESFNQFVDQEFLRLSYELHAHHEMDYPGDFSLWVKRGFSELPGELSEEERAILKQYYARIAHEIYTILKLAQKMDAENFANSLAPLMGFSSQNILQVVCFHDFKTKTGAEISIHSYQEIEEPLRTAHIAPFRDISSVELDIGHWSLQIRVKPMNKFTTTAIKMNCSVKVRQSSDS